MGIFKLLELNQYIVNWKIRKISSFFSSLFFLIIPYPFPFILILPHSSSSFIILQIIIPYLSSSFRILPHHFSNTSIFDLSHPALSFIILPHHSWNFFIIPHNSIFFIILPYQFVIIHYPLKTFKNPKLSTTKKVFFLPDVFNHSKFLSSCLVFSCLPAMFCMTRKYCMICANNWFSKTNTRTCVVWSLHLIIVFQDAGLYAHNRKSETQKEINPLKT